ncbi:hypothetical protein HDZ31DRAFT_50191 [Schizophyllum fasciatum]
MNEVLPQLRAPYMRLLHETHNLRNAPRRRTPVRGECTCRGEMARRLSVFVLRMDSIGRVHVAACRCRPASTQLVEVGLFPCAPYRPSLAVDINLLDFARLLFLQISPNVTAWCKALEAFLIARSHKIQYSDNLRKRFGYALLWFTQLHDMVQERVDRFITGVLDGASATLISDDSDEEQARSDPPSSPVAGPSPLPSPAAGQRRKRPQNSDGDGRGDDHDPTNEDGRAHPLDRPSAYLRSRCPACFGGGDRISSVNPSAPDSIVQLDACFSQKHNLQTRDPAFHHPGGIMLSEAALADAERRVDAARMATKRPRKRQAREQPSVDDDLRLGGGRVPADALQNCEDRFKAAQEKIAKANAGLHDITAVMAILCRHDIPLFLANMTTAGEKQYYAVALLDAYMDHLPADWRVGVLYDIACQMHSSAIRHGILDKYLHRLHFAVSVFHAFGHDWPCQLIYHPRKCVGFGLTDGEGCERFWYSISKLVPYLRVAGFHLRLYTLDSQIAFATKDAQMNLSAWFVRKQKNTDGKREEARLLMDEAGGVGQEEAQIREQWAAQVREQTRPMPKQDKSAGRKAVERAMELQLELQDASDNLAGARSRLADGESDSEQADIQLAEASEAAARAAYERKMAELGVDERRQLKQLLGSKPLQLRANALILLRRIQAGIMKRKMEVERVVHAHRNKNSESKLRKHIKTGAERREGTIRTLVGRYNKECRELARLIKRSSRRKSLKVRPLKELPTSGLWDLDIDNPCWDDLRFDAAIADGAPLWMVDDDMRRAIRGRLLLDRCEEEDTRLAHERQNAIAWLAEQWQGVQRATERALREPGRHLHSHLICRAHGFQTLPH